LGWRQPTLADIAALTGFGTNTVSLALRNSSRISEETRNKIRAAARELDYVPNHVAKSLAIDRTLTVGLILHSITNPIVTQAAKLIQLALAAQGYSVLLATSNGSFEEELHAIAVFRSRMVDGLLIYPLLHAKIEHLVELRSKNFPIVLLNGYQDAPVDAVGVDEFRGAYLATRHLIDLGHTRIGTILPMETKNTEKYDGYLAALREARLRQNKDVIFAPPTHSIAAGLGATNQIMDRRIRPSALFASSDLYALGALRWATINKVAVPEKLAIVGFDNIESAQNAVLPITTINNDVAVMSRRAVDRLCVLMASRNNMPPPKTELIEPTLVIRESTVGQLDSHAQ
jgi:LacI family transcriptional regulator